MLSKMWRYCLLRKIFLTSYLFLFLAMLIWSPAGGYAGEKNSPKVPWRVTYHDGSANEYRFWQDQENETARFEYSPVKPEESSTGMYSGGEPATGDLKPKQVEKLWQRVRCLESDASLRAQDRNKGTGAFYLKESGRSRDFIIMAGRQLDAWNKFLSEFRRGKQGLVKPGK